MKICDIDKNKLSPMMKQYVEIKEENMDVILFFRLGDFYEMFFEDAYTASRELELTLTGKTAGLPERIPMCGVPHHAVNFYLEKLIDKGYKVAICEQVEDPKDAKGVVKREVLQIVSLVITIIGAVISMIVLPLLTWYKNAKKDGKIDKEEIKEGLDTLQNGIEGVKNTLDDKKKGDKH